MVLPRKERGGRGRRESPFLIESQELGHALLGDIVEGDDPPFASLRETGGEVELLARFALVGDVVDDEPTAFPYAKAGVVQEQDEEIISAPPGAFEIDPV
jgi:hypothetical protein